ncbi:class I SAM-dependent methyltransferase [Engelhardtia mirabilis]|uniref:Malonyl-[acyl-carrier protein] O-methyltransferase n=1 Tax=Engelhardtia mirabilis TaxID=2528011 RepID=A0A518BG77_9BACT|nr:Malonyl-[acyl-carrier protein] O-methyltransferase [Planctomycetes bacterium Pla133]QDV00301.1 Malonyl-[acyl-carrier protein] O-methyltransferase [Planctomycetes bacterium Pla86]
MAPLFDPVAEAYRSFRPSYPAALLDRLDQLCGPPRGPVVDVGCGTGILARQLAARGAVVIGIDPSRPMLAQARQDAAGPIYLLGEAEALPIADGSAGRVTAAQAMHWFDIPAFAVEARRVARPGAWGLGLWNRRQDSGLAGDYDQIMRRSSERYARHRHGAPTLDQLRAAVAPTEVIELRQAWSDPLNWEAYLGRARSTSYMHHAERDRAELEADLRQSFERWAGPDGRAPLDYEAVAYAWPLLPAD